MKHQLIRVKANGQQIFAREPRHRKEEHRQPFENKTAVKHINNTEVYGLKAIMEAISEYTTLEGN